MSCNLTILMLALLHRALKNYVRTSFFFLSAIILGPRQRILQKHYFISKYVVNILIY